MVYFRNGLFPRVKSCSQAAIQILHEYTNISLPVPFFRLLFFSLYLKILWHITCPVLPYLYWAAMVGFKVCQHLSPLCGELMKLQAYPIKIWLLAFLYRSNKRYFLYLLKMFIYAEAALVYTLKAEVWVSCMYYIRTKESWHWISHFKQLFFICQLSVILSSIRWPVMKVLHFQS